MYKSLIFIAILFCSFSNKSNAQETDKAVVAKFLLAGGIEFGGDDLLEVAFTNGETQSIKAGQGGYVEIGGQFHLSQLKNFLLRASIGFKYTTTAAENADIRLTRLPINISGNYMATKDIRIGVGLSTHQNIRLKGDGFIEDYKLNKAIGPRFEIAYKWFGLSYTIMNYVDEMDEKYSANSIGFSVSIALPNK